MRAVLALVWAAALVIAVGDKVPTTSSDVPVVAAALLASYPAIDVVASIAGALSGQAPVGACFASTPRSARSRSSPSA